MQSSFRLQITDLEPIESVAYQDITVEDAKKITGGKKDKEPKEPKEPKNPIDDPPMPDMSIVINLSI